MKNFYVVLLLAVSTPAFAGKLDRLAFLRGCWGTVNEHGSKVSEDWLKNSDDTMLGVAQTVSASNLTVNHEFLTIAWNDIKRKIIYQAIIDGHPAAAFTFDAKQSGSAAEKRAVFVNPENDFPQAISYTLKEEGIMAIALRGPGQEGQPMEITYELSREDCGTRF